MKKIVLSISTFLVVATSVSIAQNNAGCGVYQAQEHYIKTIPGYKQQIEIATQKSKADFDTYLQRKSLQKTTAILPTYTVPVVFHILHTGGPENISDANCIAALNQVNKDYARQSSDTATIDPLYEPLYVNSRIKFVLAKKDPQGNCTNGIIHHYDENTEWGRDFYAYTYSTIGTNNWSPTKYLNIYIVKNIADGGTAGTTIGYTFLPGTSPNIGSDAIVYRYDNLLGLLSRSLSHEIGHWLGLSHTFGSSNNAGIVCGSDDIYDTPNTSGFFSTCPPISTLSDSCDPGKRPNLENIMDYSGCPKMFTQGQTDKMRSSLESSVANRNNLWSTANLQLTGIINNTNTACAPVADFVSNKVNVCTGQTVSFNSTSFNSTPTSYLWTFEGGTPATSTLASQTVTYSTPGVYSVTLTVSNANGTSTKVSSSYVYAFWNAGTMSYPYSEGFETGGIPTGWYANNKDFNSITWQSVNYGSQNSSKSFYLNNAGGYYQGHIDILETPQFNFRNTTGISISFDYSTARKTGGVLGNRNSLKFQYSLDCGGTWQNVSGGVPNDSIMARNTGGTLSGPYAPTSNKWATRSYSSVLLGTTFNNKSDVKFRFMYENNYETAQNIYIDNFNITGVVSVNELENTIGLVMYPNPTNGVSLLEFTTPTDSKVEVSVYDVTGRLIEGNQLNSVAGIKTSYAVNSRNTLSSGIYFVTLNIDNQKITKKLVID